MVIDPRMAFSKHSMRKNILSHIIQSGLVEYFLHQSCSESMWFSKSQHRFTNDVAPGATWLFDHARTWSGYRIRIWQATRTGGVSDAQEQKIGQS